MATTLDEETVARAGDGPGRTGRARAWLPIAGAVVAVLLLAWGAKAWWFARSHETTDDAQVDGHIIPVLAKVGGYVTVVRAQENRAVKAGDTLVVLDDRDYRAALAKADAELAAAIAST